MTILDYLKHIGKHDTAQTQIIYAGALFMLINAALGVALVWPLCLQQASLRETLTQIQQQNTDDAVLLNQSVMLKSRFDAIMKEREQGQSCEWQPGKETDNIDLQFEQAKGCLASWIQDNHKTIIEMTFYKKGKVRSIEVVHD